MTDVAVHSEFSLLSDLASNGALTTTALTLDPDTSYETWEALGTMLGQLQMSMCWLVGDWLNFGETVYGERAAQASDIGVAYQTAINYASVARRVPPERRRRGLSFAHHAVIAKLEPAEQDRWLDEAQANDWRRSDLEHAVKGESTPGSTIRELAYGVWVASIPWSGEIDGIAAEGYFVPAEPMQSLGAAL